MLIFHLFATIALLLRMTLKMKKVTCDFSREDDLRTSLRNVGLAHFYSFPPLIKCAVNDLSQIVLHTSFKNAILEKNLSPIEGRLFNKGTSLC